MRFVLYSQSVQSRRRSLSGRDRAYEGIRQRIVNLTLPPGIALSEQELGDALDVSRTPVREAIVLLAREGLLQVVPRIGTFVARVDPEQVAEAQFLREAVELASLASLAEPLDEAVLALMRQNLVEQEAADDDAARFFPLDEAFHQHLMSLAGHEASWHMVLTAKSHLDRARLLGLSTFHETVHERIAEHRAIFEEITDGRLGEATDALRVHLRHVFEDIEGVRALHPEMFVSDPGAQPMRRAVAVWR